MKIIFVRHGESEYNVNPVEENEGKGLTRKGKMQAKYLGNSLKNEKISIVYTSSLLRAKQTGEIISKIINVPIKASIEELDEYSSKHLKSILQILFNKRLKRLKSFLKNISKDREEDKTVLIIAHGITNRIIIGYLLQLPLKHLIRVSQHNTCMNSISWKKEFNNWSIRCVNNIEHLPIKLRDN
jgi:broad specificity phosphatase PhoE